MDPISFLAAFALIGLIMYGGPKKDLPKRGKRMRFR